MRDSNTWLFLTLLVGACATEVLPPKENHAPVANAGEDRQSAVGETVELDASASSDADGDILQYRWSLTSPGGSITTLANTNYVTTSFAPDVPGEYRAALIATDGTDDSAPDTVVIIAGGGLTKNVQPIAVLSAPPNVEVRTIVRLDGTESYDPDGDGIFFDWLLEGGPIGSTARLDDPLSPTPTFTPDLIGDYELSLVVNDGTADSTSVSVVVAAVAPPNLNPVADAGRDVAVATGTLVNLDGTGSGDPEGAAIQYIWSLIDFPTGSSATLSSASGARPTFTPLVDGAYTVQLVVSDGTQESLPDTVIVTSVTGNVPPNANAGMDLTVEVGQVAQLDAAASSDNENDALTYAWTITSRPAGSTAQLSTDSAISPTLTPDAVGAFDVQLVVNDGTADSAPDTMKVTAVSPNSPPVPDAGLDQQGRVLDVVQLNASGSSDPDGDMLTFTWAFGFKPAASAATLTNSTSATATFEPDVAGTYSLTLTANDGLETAMDTMTVTVLDPWPMIEGDIVITEVMADPSVLSDADGEWFEIYNPTNTTWNLMGCVLSDLGTDSTTIDASLLAQPMSYLTLARTASPGFGPDYVYTGYALANGGDEVILTCGSSEIAQVPMLTAFGFAASVPRGASLALLRSMDETENDNGANWCESTADYNGDKGTPGAPNEFQTACP